MWAFGSTRTWVGACGSMSRIAITRSSSWSRVEGISPATMGRAGTIRHGERTLPAARLVELVAFQTAADGVALNRPRSNGRRTGSGGSGAFQRRPRRCLERWRSEGALAVRGRRGWREHRERGPQPARRGIEREDLAGHAVRAGSRRRCGDTVATAFSRSRVARRAAPPRRGRGPRRGRPIGRRRSRCSRRTRVVVPTLLARERRAFASAREREQVRAPAPSSSARRPGRPCACAGVPGRAE